MLTSYHICIYTRCLSIIPCTEKRVAVAVVVNESRPRTKLQYSITQHIAQYTLLYYRIKPYILPIIIADRQSWTTMHDRFH